MIHLFYFLLHAAAALLGGVLLFLTIPLHIVYTIVTNNGKKSRKLQADIAIAQGANIEAPKESAGLGRVLSWIIIPVIILMVLGMLVNMMPR